MAKYLKPKPKKGARIGILVFGLCLALCAAALAIWPRSHGSAAGDVEAGQFLVHVYTTENTSVESVVLDLAENDLHHFTLKPGTTGSTGYCQVTVTDNSGIHTYFISPINQGDTVNLEIQAASGSAVAFSSGADTPPAENPAAVVYPLPLPDTTLSARLDVSRTPSVEYNVPEGATLESIAEFYSVSPGDILAYNSIDSIAPGTVLRIPNPATDESFAPPQIATVPQTEPETLLSAETETAPAETEAPEPEDDTVYVNGVPRYFQTDYPDIYYANGTIATEGCSVTCLTMVANAVTGYDYTVDELADYFGGRAENNMARLEIGSEKLGLSFYKSENWHKTLEALKEGKIVIALMTETSLFTDGQHLIVLTGLNEDGKIMVNDPNEYNYDVWKLKNAFANGFTPDDILLGYSGAWVYERTLEETPPRYSEPRLDRSEENKNYPITLTVEDRKLLAQVIWVEAQGECAEGQQAVAEVVFNRMLSDEFGDTVNDVIYGKDAFRSVPYLEDAKPTQAQYEAIDRALYGTPVLDQNVFYFATYATNSNVYKQIGNHIFCYEADS